MMFDIDEETGKARGKDKVDVARSMTKPQNNCRFGEDGRFRG